jgi:hypothetical protein
VGAATADDARSAKPGSLTRNGRAAWADEPCPPRVGNRLGHQLLVPVSDCGDIVRPQHIFEPCEEIPLDLEMRMQLLSKRHSKDSRVQPTATTIAGAGSGEELKHSAQASGTGAVRSQWRREGRPLGDIVEEPLHGRKMRQQPHDRLVGRRRCVGHRVTTGHKGLRDGVEPVSVRRRPHDRDHSLHRVNSLSKKRIILVIL